MKSLSEQVKELEKSANPNTIREICKILKRVHEDSKMDTASFSQINPNDKYPTNEKEADEFIKSRISLWMRTWVESPVRELLVEYDKEG